MSDLASHSEEHRKHIAYLPTSWRINTGARDNGFLVLLLQNGKVRETLEIYFRIIPPLSCFAAGGMHFSMDVHQGLAGCSLGLGSQRLCSLSWASDMAWSMSLDSHIFSSYSGDLIKVLVPE